MRQSVSVLMFLAISISSQMAAETSASSYENSVGMTLRRVEAGSFQMGQSNGEWDEQPVRTVTISQSFYLSETEITNAQYEQFDPDHAAFRGKHGLSSGDDEAAVYVSWHEAMAFCEWLSQKEGVPYRLPTEAEWEYVCRAGTATAFFTGDTLPETYHKNQNTSWTPVAGINLTVGQTPPNAWGFYDMHGNVEEWCLDWYGPYPSFDQTDPIGYGEGIARVTRGGSHSTPVQYLRSANRMSTLPEDKHWLIGFRVVQGHLPETALLPCPTPPRWAQHVSQESYDWSEGPDTHESYFRGPRQYVFVPPNSNGPLYSRHNHQPAITACPNGDLLAIWYTCNTEPGRELAVAASRLRRGAESWEPADLFWDMADRNDHGTALFWDGDQTIYFTNGLCTDATWGKLALILRTSTDNGVTWSTPRIINDAHGLRNMPIAGLFRTQEDYLVLPCDAVTGGAGGSAVHISKDGGQTWIDPGRGRPSPSFSEGSTGAWIAGIHAAVIQQNNGNLLAFGRGNDINGKMPISVSSDMGENWTYSASALPPLGGGQRATILRLKEGPLFMATFFPSLKIQDAAGQERAVSGLVGMVSYDDGQTWPLKRLITDDGPPRLVDGGGNTGWFTLGPDTAEPKGYLASTQSPDGIIHLISSKQHYAFNLKWLQTPMPEGPAAPTLTMKQYMQRIFNADVTPAQAEPEWFFTGSGMTENQAVQLSTAGHMTVITGPNQRARWFNQSVDGFAAASPETGLTCEIRMQVTRSTSPTRGVDFEVYLGDGNSVHRRYFLSVTTTGVFWFDGGTFRQIASQVDNASEMHAYRLSIRPEGDCLVYRDNEFLAAVSPSAGFDNFLNPDGPYLQWGEGAGASEADFIVDYIAWDMAGAFRPAVLDPKDGRTDVDPLTHLEWPSEFDCLYTYDVCLGESPDNLVRVASGLHENTYKPNPLKWGVSYYWKVTAFDNNSSNPGPMWTFTTQSAVCGEPLRMDVNNDCVVDMKDLVFFLEEYLSDAIP